MSNFQAINMGEISSALDDDREDHPYTDSPHARAEPPPAAVDDSAQLRHQAPYSPLFFGSEDGPAPSSSLPDYDDEDSDAGSPIRSITAANGANQGSLENIRAADDFLLSLDEDFHTASAVVTRDMSVKINATSRDNLRREYNQRQGVNNNVRNDELVRKHMLPGLMNLATAMAEEARKTCSGVIQDQLHQEYEAYASANRDEFIEQLAQEAWPLAVKRIENACREDYRIKLAENDRDIEEYRESEFDKLAQETRDMRAFLQGETDARMRAYQIQEFSRVKEWVLEKSQQSQGLADARVTQYRKDEEAKCESDVADEKKRRKAIMRRALAWEMAEEKKAKMAAMEAEMAAAKAQKWAQMESEVEAARNMMLAKAASEAASGKEVVAAPVNEENGPPAVTGPSAPANAPLDGEIILKDSEDDEAFEGDTTLVNDAASSPPARAKTPRGRKRHRSDSDNECEKPTTDLKPTKKAKIATNEDDQQGPAPATISKIIDFAYPASHPRHRPNNAQNQNDKPRYHFRASGLKFKMSAPPAAAVVSSTPTPPATQDAVVQSTESSTPPPVLPKQKYTFGRVNELKNAEL